MHGIFLVFSARISAEFFASDTASAVISLVILIPSGLGKKVDTTLSPRRNEMIQKHVKLLDSVYLTFYCCIALYIKTIGEEKQNGGEIRLRSLFVKICSLRLKHPILYENVSDTSKYYIVLNFYGLTKKMYRLYP